MIRMIALMIVVASAALAADVEFQDIPLDTQVDLDRLGNLRQAVTNEVDPRFEAWRVGFEETDPRFVEWCATNTYVKAETDPVFLFWEQNFRESDPEFQKWRESFKEEDPAFVEWKNADSVHAGRDAGAMQGGTAFGRSAFSFGGVSVGQGSRSSRGGTAIGAGANAGLLEIAIGASNQTFAVKFGNKPFMEAGEVLESAIPWAARKQDKLAEGDGVRLGQPRVVSGVKTQTISVDRPYVQGVAMESISAWSNANVVVDGDILEVEVITPNGTTSVWSSSSVNDSEIASLKQQAQALLRRIEELEAGGGASSWNEWGADGTANPEPEYMTLLNRPATMLASGFSWQTSGAYAVLTQSGSVAFATGTDGGEFRIGHDSTNYFGVAMGGTIVVGARCQTMESSTAGRPDGTVSMAYDYAGGDFPTLWYAPSLGIEFAEQTGVVWVDNGDGTATVTAPAATKSGFWYATTSKKVGAIFKSTMPIRADGGIFVDGQLPVVYDDVITIEQGGRRYRIPAQGVQ